MVSRIVDFCLQALLITFFLPSLAWYFIQAVVAARLAGSSHATIREGDQFRQTVGEFNFENAIEAYEELIDSTFAGGQL